ncbi:DUF1918 domain-containing protein [uncultured Mycolicibacterium sp.]|uniref:DUF1918 domain-containing protein n=1 Tax=uncultured Mycolicibacterium sp. TaxID=2320817 RepID=UPI0026304E28|nr:DUF1918 domain-containing protein [uncultured Mycolicibacterium sp.]
MQANVGDWLVVKGSSTDRPEQHGVIVEVRGPNGAPPYVVRWDRDDHVSTVFPGPDAIVLTPAEYRTRTERGRTGLARAGVG